jgi:oligopeptidase B
MRPPIAKTVPHQATVHGQQRSDPYAWLREKDSADVLAYLEAENAYTDEAMADTEQLQSALYQEMIGRIQETDLSVPVQKYGFFYYSRTEEGLQYPIYCRKAGSLEADEEILLDLNVEARGHDYFSLGVFEVSPDHRILAYATDTDGSETFTLRFKALSKEAVAGGRGLAGGRPAGR